MIPPDLAQQMVLHAARPFPGEESLAELRRLLQGTRPVPATGATAGADRAEGLSRSTDPGPAPADVLEVATRARTVPQVARNLALVSGGEIPAGWEALADSARTISWRNLSRIRALLLLLDSFDSAGIPVIPYKGPVLAETLYGDATLRQYKDLDLLVEPEHVPGAVATLRMEGYRETKPSRPLTPGQLRGVTRWFREHHITLLHPDTGVEVELHWALLPRIRFPTGSELTRHPVEQRLGGRTLRTLGPEGLLVYLCAHGSKHGWARLSRVADVRAFLLSQPETDWDAVRTLAERLGLTGSLALGLALAESAMDTPLPAPLQLQLDPLRADLNPLLQVAHRSIWTGGDPVSPGVALDYADMAYGGRVGSLRYIAARALPGQHLLEKRLLPAPLFPLYLLENLRHQMVRSTQLLMGRDPDRT